MKKFKSHVTAERIVDRIISEKQRRRAEMKDWINEAVNTALKNKVLKMIDETEKTKSTCHTGSCFVATTDCIYIYYRPNKLQYHYLDTRKPKPLKAVNLALSYSGLVLNSKMLCAFVSQLHIITM